MWGVEVVKAQATRKPWPAALQKGAAGLR